MSDTKGAKKFEEQLATEVAILRDLAIRSIDPLVIAKAVAASDPGIQQAIIVKLDAGERLAEVLTLRGSAQHELQVFFRFVAVDASVRLLDTGMLVFVDLHSGTVTGAVDPFTLQPERSVGRPFVTISALKAYGSVAGNPATEAMASREMSFFKGLGLGQFGLTTDTVCDSQVTSATYSPGPGGRYVSDDTGRETCGDYCDSSGDILA